MDKKRNMNIIVINQFLTQLADSIYDIAIFWYVYEVSESALLASIITALTFTTQILLGPLLGALADRRDPKRFMQFGFLVMVCVGLFMAIVYNYLFDYFLVLIYFGLILHDVGMFIVAPSKNRLLPRIIDMDKIMKVNGYINSTGQMASLIGTSISGFIIALLGFVGVMLSHSLIYLIASLLLLFLISIHGSEVANTESAATDDAPTKHSWLKDLKEGYIYIRGKKEVFKLVIIAMVVNISSMVGPLFVVLVQEQYNGNEVTFGIFSAVGSIASIIVGFTVERFSKKMSVSQLFIYTFMISGAMLVFMTFTSIPWIGMLFYFLFVFTLTLLNINLNTFLITLVEDQYRGRVLGIIMAISGSLIPIFSLLGGLLADLYHVNIVYLISGIWTILVGVYTIFDKDMKTISFKVKED